MQTDQRQFIDEDDGAPERAEAPEPQHFHEYVSFEQWSRDWKGAFTKCVVAHGAEFADPTRLVGLRNPLDTPQRFRIHLGYPEGVHSNPLRLRRFDPRLLAVQVTVPPGETVLVPRAWARAVHTIRGGLIVGGLAPRLRIVDPTSGADLTRETHPALRDAGEAPKFSGKGRRK